MDAKITITTLARGTGAETTTQKLQDLTHVVHDSKKAHEGAGAAAGKHALGHHELKVAAHALGLEIPHLNGLMWAMKSSLVAGSLAIGAVVSMFSYLISKQKEAETAARALSVAFDPLIRKTVTHQTHAAQAAIAARDHAEAIKAIGREANSIKTHLDNLNKALELQFQTTKKLHDLKTDAATKRIEAGDLRPEAKAEAIEALKRKHDAEAAALEQQELEGKAELTAQARMKARLAAAEASKQLPGELERQAEMKSLAAQREAARATAQASVDKLIEEAKTMKPMGPLEYFMTGEKGVWRGGRTPAMVRDELMHAKMQRDKFAADKELDDEALNRQKERIDRLKKLDAGATAFDVPLKEDIARAKAGRGFQAARPEVEAAARAKSDVDYKRYLVEQVTQGLDTGDFTRGARAVPIYDLLNAGQRKLLEEFGRTGQIFVGHFDKLTRAVAALNKRMDEQARYQH